MSRRTWEWIATGYLRRGGEVNEVHQGFERKNSADGWVRIKEECWEECIS